MIYAPEVSMNKELRVVIYVPQVPMNYELPIVIYVPEVPMEGTVYSDIRI